MSDSIDNEHNKLLEQNKIQNVTGGDQPSYYNETVKQEEQKKKRIKYGIIGGVAVVAITLIIVLSVTLPKGDEQPGVTIKNPPAPAPTPNPVFPVNPDVHYNNYSASQIVNGQDTYSGFITSGPYSPTAHSVALNKLYQGLGGINHDLGINPRSLPVGPNNEYLRNVSFKFGMTGYKSAFLQMTDANNPRYYVPTQAVNPPNQDLQMRLEMLGFQLNASPFTFSFTDVADKTNVFVHTMNSSLVFMDKFIQMDFQLPSQRLYGLGERVREFPLGEGTWTMWAKGQDSPYDQGIGGQQVYGVHPFLMVQGKNKGEYFGMFFRNSNAQSPLLRFNADGTSSLSYITTGGQMEVYFFLHGTAKTIIQQYHQVIGFPTLPPLWALGWQQASWKYLTQATVQSVIDSYATANMPLETVYLDIPYMSNYEDFTVDTVNFPDLPTLGANLHNNHQKLVVIIDAGLSADDPDSQYYKMAQELQTLIMSSINTDKFNGAISQKVWATHTVFLDWFNQYAATVWYQGLKDLFALVPFDGLWIDMNEATGFCSGECPDYVEPPTTTTTKEEKSFVEALLRKLSESEPVLRDDEIGNDTTWFGSYSDQSQISTYYLPFIPGFNYGGNLDNMSLSLNATHPSLGGETEYNLHSLYGLMMAKTTNGFLTSAEYPYSANRPFVLSRSTFSGSGRYTSHWLGDNWRDWNYLTYSIAGIMNMNMYGIPHVGADVCGFFGETRDDEMCGRWIQLATFYPLARAHQNLTYKGGPSDSSEPYTLAEPWLSIARDSMFDRYQYLRHMYTCLFEVNQWGGSCIDPLFYFYPQDDNLYTNVESTFMVGGALKVSPILEAGVTDTYTSYFPAGIWVNMADFAEIIDTSAGGTDVILQARNTVNAHLKPGAMVAIQNNTDQDFQSTNDLVYRAPISLVFNRDPNGYADGTVYLDNGTSRDELQNWQYEYLRLKYSSKSINKFFSQGNQNTQNYALQHVIILNAEDLNTTDFACYMDAEFNAVNMTYLYDDGKKALFLYQNDPAINITFDQFKTIHFGDSKVDINLCGPTTYTYRIKGGALPDLTGTSTSFVLTNRANVLPDITVTLQMIQPTIVNIQWTFTTQPTGQRVPFKVPTNIVNPKINAKSSQLSNFVTITDEPFFLAVNDLTGEQLIDFYGMVYDSWLNIIQAQVHEASGDSFSGIFGLGERTAADLPYQDGVYSIWARDVGTPIETGHAPGNNDYGNHPFYMFRRDFSSWAGVFTNMVAAQDWYIKNDPEVGTVDITTVAIGGVVDIYVIIGYDPKQITSDYWNYIVGTPVLVPVFALGWNQCKWGYKVTQDLYDVVGNYSAHNIPLDTQWSDIDYMQTYRDFTYDPDRFADLPQFIADIHAKNIHYVPIVDAGIALRPWGNYSEFELGVAQDVFVKASFDNPSQDFIGMVWPNEVNYPDWFNPKAPSWWQSSLQTMWNQIPFDGLWLDMNEASNFCSPTCKASQVSSTNAQANLKIVPSNRDLNEKAISVDAYHYLGVLELDTHSLFGTQETMYTSQFFTQNNKRPFIIERSSSAGMGKYGSRWLGDNYSDIKYLENSIAGVMNMGIFGIPLSGVDICGFGGSTTGELCARWTVVGAFYPFSRNHNAIGSMPQEPYQFANEYYEDGVSYTDIMRQGIRNKYHMIRYYYTQMFLASTAGTGPFFNPLFFEFPDDKDAFEDVQYNVMLGSALKLSVNTNTLNQNSTEFYFPAGMWCNVFNATEPCFTGVKGEYVTMRTKAYDFYVHLYEGNIVPMQNATKLNAMTTFDLQNYPVDLHILGTPNKLGQAWYAAGTYVNDDGLTTTLNGNYNQYSIAAMADADTPTSITIQIGQTYYAYNYKNAQTNCTAVNSNDYLGDIYIYNAKAFQAMTKFTVVIFYNNGDTQVHGEADYDVVTNRLVYHNPAQICLSTVEYILLNKFM